MISSRTAHGRLSNRFNNPKRRVAQCETLEDRRLLAGETLWISEFVASNSSTLRDDSRNYSDWIELHNPTDQDVSLDGWYLTDSDNTLDKWRIPDVTLPAKEFMVVFASAENLTDPQEELHTNFKLSSGGEYLALVRPDNSISHEFSPAYPGTNFRHFLRHRVHGRWAATVTIVVLPRTDSGGAQWFDHDYWVRRRRYVQC